jgi:hypothetical protein
MATRSAFMKKICAVIATAIILVQFTVQAILPPLYHTLAEFKALIQDKQFVEKLNSGEVLESITLTDSKFIILTSQHRLVVEIVYERTERIGPAQFHLVFNEPQPR